MNTEIQPNLSFDAPEAKAQRDVGKMIAAAHRARILDHARVIAVQLAMQHPEREVCADDVYREMVNRDLNVELLGNAAGSLFAESCWQFTGRRVKSVRVSNHAREIKVWRLR